MRRSRLLSLVAAISLTLVAAAAVPTAAASAAACTAPAWSATAVYTGGARVLHAGHEWTAKWWTQGETPGTTGEWGVWKDEGACGGTPPPTTPPPTSAAFRFAPYVATFMGNDLTAYARDIGHDEFTLGFVNSTGACAPVWSTDEGTLRNKVTALRAAGGDVIVSSGGWNAVDLVRHCSTARAAADAYQRVLDAFGADHLDLDPEHGDQQNNLEPAIVDRRNDALKLLQDAAKARGGTLRVSYTLGVSPATGFNAENLYVLRSALQRGVELDVVNPMTMDFYDGVSGNRMGAASIQALRSVHAQLKTLYPARTDAQLWGMLAATPMIGQNDNPQEVFTLADARLLIDFARAQGMARLSFWATSRDNGGCPGQTTASASCSGISQTPYAFSSIFKGLAQ